MLNLISNQSGHAVESADLPVVRWLSNGSNPAFSLHPRSEQTSGAHANEIKHDHSPVVMNIMFIQANEKLRYKKLDKDTNL